MGDQDKKKQVILTDFSVETDPKNKQKSNMSFSI